MKDMSTRARLLAFGACAAVALAGVACALAAGGVAGEVLAIVLIGGGLAGIVLLAFMEVGFSEDRELARERDRRRNQALALLSARRGRWITRRPRRPQ